MGRTYFITTALLLQKSGTLPCKAHRVRYEMESDGKRKNARSSCEAKMESVLTDYLDNVIVPKLESAGEAWEDNATLVKQRETVQMSAVRKTPGCSATTSSTVLREYTGMHPPTSNRDAISEMTTCRKRGDQPNS